MTSRFIYRNPYLLLAAAGLGLCGAADSRADVTLPAVISDNMVLQQRADVNVWGKADPGESVTVKLGDEIAQTEADKNGNWGLKLGGLRAGGPYEMKIFGKNSLTVQNVAVGEVWMCAGESNMEYKVIAAKNAPEEMADADLPMTRVFVVKHRATDKPRLDCEGSWIVCSADSVKDLPAVGFFFARELNRGMRVPFGLIESAWGPSPIAAWMPRETLEKDPALHGVLDAYDKAVTDFPDREADFQQKLTEWKTASDAAKAAGSPPPHAPVAPLEPGGPRAPAGLYNAMIAPLTRYPIRGVLWYQGETDTVNPALYRQMFPAMIGAWRKAWGEGDFPFLYAQLSGFLHHQPQPQESRWAELREAQAAALTVPKTGMAVTIDTSEEGNMHPADKQDVAHRLVLLAQNAVYGRAGSAIGPEFDGMKVSDGKAVISFSHADGGLVALGGGALKGFEIAGADGHFVWADATIHGDGVTVQSKDIATPVAVRYDWADLPDGNLFNEAKLPAAPFRTDGPGSAKESAAASSTPGKRHGKHRAEAAQ